MFGDDEPFDISQIPLSTHDRALYIYAALQQKAIGRGYIEENSYYPFWLRLRECFSEGFRAITMDCPQSLLATFQVTNDGKSTQAKKYPDASVALIQERVRDTSALLADTASDSEHEGPGGLPFHEKTIYGTINAVDFLRIWIQESKSGESRPIRNLHKHSTNKIHTKASYLHELFAAKRQGLEQASFYFAEHPYSFVVVVVTAGPVWAFTVADRGEVSKYSPHVDTTYRGTPEKEASGGAAVGSTQDSGESDAELWTIDTLSEVRKDSRKVMSLGDAKPGVTREEAPFYEDVPLFVVRKRKARRSDTGLPSIHPQCTTPFSPASKSMQSPEHKRAKPTVSGSDDASDSDSEQGSSPLPILTPSPLPADLHTTHISDDKSEDLELPQYGGVSRATSPPSTPPGVDHRTPSPTDITPGSATSSSSVKTVAITTSMRYEKCSPSLSEDEVIEIKEKLKTEVDGFTHPHFWGTKESYEMVEELKTICRLIYPFLKDII